MATTSLVNHAQQTHTFHNQLFITDKHRAAPESQQGRARAHITRIAYCIASLSAAHSTMLCAQHKASAASDAQAEHAITALHGRLLKAMHKHMQGASL